MTPTRDLDELLAIAGRLLDGVHDQFVSGVGAPSAVRKAGVILPPRSILRSRSG